VSDILRVMHLLAQDCASYKLLHLYSSYIKMHYKNGL